MLVRAQQPDLDLDNQRACVRGVSTEKVDPHFKATFTQVIIMKINTPFFLLLFLVCTDSFGTPCRTKLKAPSFVDQIVSNAAKAITLPLLVVSLVTGPVLANDLGASSGANAKITTGGASTLQSGRTIGTFRTIKELVVCNPK